MAAIAVMEVFQFEKKLNCHSPTTQPHRRIEISNSIHSHNVHVPVAYLSSWEKSTKVHRRRRNKKRPGRNVEVRFGFPDCDPVRSASTRTWHYSASGVRGIEHDCNHRCHWFSLFPAAGRCAGRYRRSDALWFPWFRWSRNVVKSF